MMQKAITTTGLQTEQRAGGMDCPVCRMFIPVSVSMLLHDGGIMCPHCGLMMTIDKSQSGKALDALRKVEDATRKVREAESFKH